MSQTPALSQLIRKKLTIPTLPDVVLRISRLMADANCGTREIGELVSEDAPLAAKVLRIANSAYYGLSRECLSTEHASTVLGMRILKNIVTQVSVINQFEHLEKETGFDVSSIWRHAILTAQLAAKIAPLARAVRVLTPDEFYVCGLLHDVGKVVMLDGLGAPYVDVLRAADTTGRPISELERETYDFDHQDVGAVVGNRWDLPEALVGAIQLHHAERAEVGPRLHVLVVQAATQLADRAEAEDAEGAYRELGILAGDLGIETASLQSLVDYAMENRTVEF